MYICYAYTHTSNIFDKKILQSFDIESKIVFLLSGFVQIKTTKGQNNLPKINNLFMTYASNFCLSMA